MVDIDSVAADSEEMDFGSSLSLSGAALFLFYGKVMPRGSVLCYSFMHT